MQEKGVQRALGTLNTDLTPPDRLEQYDNLLDNFASFQFFFMSSTPT